MRRLLSHLDELSESTQQLSIGHAKVFCLLLAERQRLVFKKAFSDPDFYSFVAGADQWLADLWDGGNFGASLDISQPSTQSQDAGLNFIYSLDEISRLSAFNIVAVCRTVAEGSLNILDSLSYSIYQLPVNASSDNFVDFAPLVSTEISRQLEDLRAISAAGSLNDLAVFRSRSVADMTLEKWYRD